jgi:ligand-binding SRPBCC domain-containing protein
VPRIRLALLITAPVERCFDLARDIDLHQQSLTHTAERAVAGRTSGRIALGERVTWEAVHFGVQQKLTVQITDYARPYYFVDEMIHGAFARFTHRHEFAAVDAGTLMIDDFRLHRAVRPARQAR